MGASKPNIMSSKRLVVFGCSNTVGEHLPGWVGFPEKVRFSKSSWPAVLGKMMSLPVVNMAKGGNSNHEILLDILSFDFAEGDYCVVCWSFANREMLYDNEGLDNKVPTMGLLHDKHDDTFYCVHSKCDLEIKSREYMHHVELYLNNENITYQMAKRECLSEKNPNWLVYNADDYLLFEVVDYAADNLHPGIISNMKFAELLFSAI